ncbi:transcription termination factor 2 [Prorops nasuta]|uniref:transcription termination factor 2 n=1 Tax=Prorops nasuta TaxID=863751 RepID=UPI0034CE2295
MIKKQTKMNNSFTEWRSTPRSNKQCSSIIDSDTDEEINEKSENNLVISETSWDESRESNIKPIVDESPILSEIEVKRRLRKQQLVYTDSDDSDDSYKENIQSNNDATRNWGKNTGKRKDISHDFTKEKIKDAKLSFSTDKNETFYESNENEISYESNENETSYESNENEDQSDSSYEICEIIKSENSGLDSTEHKTESNLGKDITEIDRPASVITIDSDSENVSKIVEEFAKEEIGVSNINPIEAQKQALLQCKLDKFKAEMAKINAIINNTNLDVLPDKGEKLMERKLEYLNEIEEMERQLGKIPLVDTFIKDEKYEDDENKFYLPPKDLFNIKDEKVLGERAQKKREMERALTIDRLQDLHGSLNTRPKEDEQAEDPSGLRVCLMPHQKHALLWLLWRETQKPAGGILADDMGLGKTLTMIALVMTSLAQSSIKSDSEHTEDSEDEWEKSHKPISNKGGTLVICPASLLAQWEGEVKSRCKRGMLSVQIYHGSSRETKPMRLANYDIVVTTYNIVARENKTQSTLFQIRWQRIILDEAHIVRNHKTQASLGVCALRAIKRWALTGTPVHNKEIDLYAILKFLKCSPFDDLKVWKRWVDSKDAAGQQRLATVMKSIMLRRTKQELQNKGEIESLPSKSLEVIEIKLDTHEKLAYEKVLVYSRTLFAQFLSQRAEKEHMIELHGGRFNKPTFLSNPNKQTQFTKAQSQLLSMHADVKSHEILVLLLRLRQICCHPALIHSMLDQEEIAQSGFGDEENLDTNLLRQINNINLKDTNNHPEEGTSEDDDEIGVDMRVKENILTSDNPLFDDNRISSKMKAILNTVKEIIPKGEKLIIVSQWASMLKVVAKNLKSVKNARCIEFTGSVAIKNRQSVMDAFNNPDSNVNILLLSLTAGGVGLNLVGGNHLLLIDIHWNPQLESQAQDRIYRFGQKRDVYIYKFICKDTVEERILKLQEYKLGLASNVLACGKGVLPSKLSMDDLKSIFGF